jgi:cysteine synthase A
MEKYSQTTLLVGGIAIGAGAVLAAEKLCEYWPFQQAPKSNREPRKSAEDIRNGLEECIGNTPLIRIKCLSEATGCEILGKAEVSLWQAPPSLRLMQFVVSGARGVR